MPGPSRRCSSRSVASGHAIGASRVPSCFVVDTCLIGSVPTWLLAAFLVLGQASGVQAEPPQRRPAGATAEPEVKTILREAVQEFDLGNWTEARALFERAHELQPTARTFRAIGLSAFEEKSYAAAVWNLSQSLTDNRNPLDAGQRSKVEDVLRRARGFVAEYKLELKPAAAQLTVDGRKPTLLEGKLLLDPGDRLIQLSAPGHQSSERHVSARPNENGFLHIALSPEVVAQAPAGEPATNAELPAPQPAPKSTTDPRFGTQQIVGMAVAGAGVASLAVSLGFVIRAKNKRDASGCDGADCPPDQKSNRLNDQALLAGNVSTVTVIVGAAAVGTGAFLYFWRPREKKTSPRQAHFAPGFAPGLIGVSCGGQW